jgi:hypothetical protein
MGAPNSLLLSLLDEQFKDYRWKMMAVSRAIESLAWD